MGEHPSITCKIIFHPIEHPLDLIFSIVLVFFLYQFSIVLVSIMNNVRLYKGHCGKEYNIVFY